MKVLNVTGAATMLSVISVLALDTFESVLDFRLRNLRAGTRYVGNNDGGEGKDIEGITAYG